MKVDLSVDTTYVVRIEVRASEVEAVAKAFKYVEEVLPEDASATLTELSAHFEKIRHHVFEGSRLI